MYLYSAYARKSTFAFYLLTAVLLKSGGYMLETEFLTNIYNSCVICTIMLIFFADSERR